MNKDVHWNINDGNETSTRLLDRPPESKKEPNRFYVDFPQLIYIYIYIHIYILDVYRYDERTLIS